MRWRTIVLAALGIGLGVTAGVCIAEVIRIDTALNATYAAGDSGLTAAQSASVAALISQGAALYQFAGPLVVGFLLSVVGLLVVLAGRWQAPRPDAQR
jgi:hypothetical protein